MQCIFTVSYNQIVKLFYALGQLVGFILYNGWIVAFIQFISS